MLIISGELFGNQKFRSMLISHDLRVKKSRGSIQRKQTSKDYYDDVNSTVNTLSLLIQLQLYF